MPRRSTVARMTRAVLLVALVLVARCESGQPAACFEITERSNSAHCSCWGSRCRGLPPPPFASCECAPTSFSDRPYWICSLTEPTDMSAAVDAAEPDAEPSDGGATD